MPGQAEVAQGKSTLRRPVAGDNTRTGNSRGSVVVVGASSPAAFGLGLKTPMFLGLPLLLEHRVPLLGVRRRCREIVRP